jgi:hypothetical protein
MPNIFLIEDKVIEGEVAQAERQAQHEQRIAELERLCRDIRSVLAAARAAREMLAPVAPVANTPLRLMGFVTTSDIIQMWQEMCHAKHVDEHGRVGLHLKEITEFITGVAESISRLSEKIGPVWTAFYITILLAFSGLALYELRMIIFEGFNLIRFLATLAVAIGIWSGRKRLIQTCCFVPDM